MRPIKKLALAITAVFMLLLAACNNAYDSEAELTQTQQRVLELEALGVSITTIPVSVFSDYDFSAVPVAVSIWLDVDWGTEWGITDESNVKFIVESIGELTDYIYDRRIPLLGISGIDFGAFHNALANRGLSEIFSDMIIDLIRDHPIRDATIAAFYESLLKIDVFIAEGNMLWLEEFGIEVNLLIIGTPLYLARGSRDIAIPQFLSIPDVPFGITCQESLELFMDAVALITVMHLGRWPDIDDAIMHNLGMHQGPGNRTLRVLFDEGMDARLREVYCH